MAADGGLAPRDVQKILVVRLGSMGDIIHALPAVAALRQAFPNAKIGWAIEERWAELLCSPSAGHAGPLSPQHPLVDLVHTVNTFAWRSNLLSSQTRREVKELKRALRIEEYDAAIDFQGALKSAMIARWAKASAIYGFSAPREKLARRFYSQKVEVAGTHIVEQNLSLAESLAQEKLKMPGSLLPRDAVAEQKMRQWLEEHKISGFALLNPGAGWGAKQWPAERYGHVAKQLAANGLSCLINFGPREETLAKIVRQESEGTAQPVNCSISELVALTRHARLFIGGDTGPMHLAAALGVPVIAIFGPTDPARNGPFATRNIVLRNSASPTSYSHHDNADEGLLQISVQDVLAAARELAGSVA
ncbi:MAG TPA: lipopolysaccharide heptosyltransferase I [Terriglobales bacterium]|jgi:heptosyltransferase-1